MGSFHDDDETEFDEMDDFCDDCCDLTKVSFIKINKNEKVLAVYRFPENSIPTEGYCESVTAELDIVFGKGNYALIGLPFGHELELNIIDKGDNDEV